jgi:hypothetical protein
MVGRQVPGIDQPGGRIAGAPFRPVAQAKRLAVRLPPQVEGVGAGDAEMQVGIGIGIGPAGHAADEAGLPAGGLVAAVRAGDVAGEVARGKPPVRRPAPADRGTAVAGRDVAGDLHDARPLEEQEVVRAHGVGQAVIGLVVADRQRQRPDRGPGEVGLVERRRAVGRAAEIRRHAQQQVVVLEAEEQPAAAEVLAEGVEPRRSRGAVALEGAADVVLELRAQIGAEAAVGGADGRPVAREGDAHLVGRRLPGEARRGLDLALRGFDLTLRGLRLGAGLRGVLLGRPGLGLAHLHVAPHAGQLALQRPDLPLDRLHPGGILRQRGRRRHGKENTSGRQNSGCPHCPSSPSDLPADHAADL